MNKFLVLPITLSILHAAAPTTDPTVSYNLPWTGALHWSKSLDITTIAGATDDEKIATAMKTLTASGGGTIYFPAGIYTFKNSIKINDGIILRGEAPTAQQDARQENYSLTTKFIFPQYKYSAGGNGSPLDSAFKSIELADPSTASNVAIIHLDINHGHCLFTQSPEGKSGKNRIIHGCIFRNSAYADPGIPDAKINQKPHQRYTWRFGAAIDAKSSENLLITNNRLAKSGEDNFIMNDYVLLDNKKQPITINGVPFDYDNRPGIYANHESLGGPGGQGPDGTPETHPLGFRKGMVIRHNYVYSTGRCAIGFSGDGTICSDNVIRFAKDVWRPSATGRDRTGGASTNDNRALELRGWRWTVENNDYEVYRNWAWDKKYYINDGEGLMHEDHANCIIKDSILRGNKGNSYLSMYKTAGVDGLLVENNDIRIASNAGALPAIFVCSNRTNDAFPTKNVRIVNNIVGGTGIIIDGSKDSTGNIIQGNKTAGEPNNKEEGYIITNQANAKVSDNKGFSKVDTTPWISKTERDAKRK